MGESVANDCELLLELSGVEKLFRVVNDNDRHGCLLFGSLIPV